MLLDPTITGLWDLEFGATIQILQVFNVEAADVFRV